MAMHEPDGTNEYSVRFEACHGGSLKVMERPFFCSDPQAALLAAEERLYRLRQENNHVPWQVAEILRVERRSVWREGKGFNV